MFLKKIILTSVFFLSQALASYAAPVTQEQNFLVISDVHVDSSSKHVMEFNPSTTSKLNDLDKPTFETLIASIGDNIQHGVIAKPKFILYLGDLVGHNRSTADFVLNSETTVFTALIKQFPDTPILYTFGNNDSFQVDYGPFTSTYKIGVPITTPLDVAYSTGDWVGGFLSTGNECQKSSTALPCMITENTTDGYYAAYLEQHLRLISLNTVMFSPNRINIQDETLVKQLSWLETQLNDAQAQHDAVLLTMHIPPGNNVYDDSNFWTATENTKFLGLIKRYNTIIIGILAAHTHKDEIKIIQNSSHQNVIGVYLTAALSTSHGNAPSVRTFSYSKLQDQWQLTNYDVFYFIKNKDATVMLKKLYDYRDYYCNSQEKTILQCLSNLSVEKLEKYFTAGNDAYHEKIAYPQDILINLE